ncbi:hypothetical protein FS837_011536 [Tulasnella sp. UAMH 9824]|nr:hypothetical protein FS837_011536 [Tulasnella sp. UAMH 9824]
MRPVKTGDELCIYYGSKLWFPSAAKAPTTTPEIVLSDQEADDVLPGISLLHDEGIVPPAEAKVKPLANEPEPKSTALRNPSSTSPPVSRSSKERKTKGSKKDSTLTPAVGKGPPVKDIVPPEQLPFERFKFPDEDVVEPDDGPIPTMDIWATDVLEPRKIGLLLEHIRLNSDSYRTEALDHLKRIRRVTGPDDSEPRTQLALSPHIESSPGPPSLPPHLSDFASSPFVVTVPSTHAVNQTQLTRKNVLWPVCYYPMLETKKEKEWTKQEVEGMREGAKKAIEAGREAKKQLGELPIAAYVTTTFDPEVAASTSTSWTDYDTRNSTHHPLRHACMNIIRKVASSDSALSASSTDTTQQPSYLLTGYTLFITHEPCIMCCMALLHSRVKDVVYIKPMPKTGGLGGRGADEHKALVEDSVPGLKGVNHRFGIWRWTENLDGATEIDVDQTVDA